MIFLEYNEYSDNDELEPDENNGKCLAILIFVRKNKK